MTLSPSRWLLGSFLCLGLLATQAAWGIDAEVLSSEAQRLGAHGDALLAAGDAAGAAESYRAAIAADPRAFEARINLGAALTRAGDLDGAIETLEAARKVRPDVGPLLRNLGRAYLARERFDDALGALRKAAAVDASNPDSTRLLGIALQRDGKHADALPVLRKAVAQNPKDLELLVELATAETDAADPAAKGTIDRAKKLAGDGTEGAKVHNQLGLLLRERGRIAEATDEFRAAAHVDPNYSPALGNLGMSLVEAGEWKRAVGTLEGAVRRDNDPQLRFFLGQAKLGAGDAKGAIADLEEARSWGYDPVQIAKMLAAAWEQIGDADKAEAERKRAGPALLADAADANAKKGFELLAAGKWPEAEAALDAAAKARPDDGATQFNLGLARMHMGDAAGALAPLSAASVALGNESVVWFALGEARHRTGNRPAAIDAFKQALMLDRKRPDIAALVGHLLLEEGRDDEALVRLVDAKRGLPKDPAILYDLAVAWQRRKNPAAAIQVLTDYLALRPDDTLAREALAKSLLDNGDARKAAAEYGKLAAAEPAVARHHVNLAVAWRKAGDAKNEKKELGAAAVLAPDDAQVLFDLGRLQFLDAEWAAAAQSFSRAKTLDPSLADAESNAETAKKNAALEAMKATRIHLGVIVTAKKPEADAARKRIAKGESFGKVASAVSTHESAVKGGDLGWVDPAELPAWADRARTLKTGEVSEVVAIPNAFAIYTRFEK